MPKKGTRSKKAQEEKGSEDDLKDIFDGELRSRRFGIRIDDQVEVTVIAGNEIIKVEGRLLSMKDEVELIGTDGNYIQIMSDWVVAIKVLEHNRPIPEKDKELVKRPVKSKPKKTSVDHAYS